MSSADYWQVDKRLPAAFILSLIIQTFAMIWWAATLSARVDDHDRRMNQVESSARIQTDESRKLSETLARLDERLLSQTTILRRIEEQIVRKP
jgi:hypothetical protein